MELALSEFAWRTSRMDATLRTMRSLLLLAACAAPLLAQQTPGPTASPAQSANPPAQTAPAIPPAPPPAGPGSNPAQTPATAPAAPGNAAPALSPSDAYIYAMEPFNNAHSAPNDLTDADKWALGIAIARAKDQCETIRKQTLHGEDLLALGKLCLLGQDFDPARGALVHYVILPDAKAPELGRLLLTKAFLGLQDFSSAESQMESLLTLYPYDASIHIGIDLVVDAASASDAVDDLAVIPRLNQQQLPHILDALARGGAVPASNGDTVDAALLVHDALRIADGLRRAPKPDDADKVLAQVAADTSADPIAHSPEASAIQNALIRYQWFGHPSPIRAFYGNELPPVAGTPTHRVLLYDPDPAAHQTAVHIRPGTTLIRSSDDRTLVFVFSLASPASAVAIEQTLAGLAKDHAGNGLKIVAVTSFAANLGDDTPNPAALDAIRAFHAELPAALPIFLVPDSELKPFAIDLWPAAILFDGHGRILALDTLSGSPGSARQMVREIESNFSFTLPDPAPK